MEEDVAHEVPAFVHQLAQHSPVCKDGVLHLNSGQGLIQGGVARARVRKGSCRIPTNFGRKSYFTQNLCRVQSLSFSCNWLN